VSRHSSDQGPERNPKKEKELDIEDSEDPPKKKGSEQLPT
jgi:hypothetical protein